jgi:mono/diheme cytochrome c family protein
METEMEKRNIEWPELEDDDLANIIAFVRSVGKSAKKMYLQPGSPSRGKSLFTERACAACHSPDSDDKLKAPDLSRIELPHSLSALGSRMWNHSPKMRAVMAEHDIKTPPLTPQEMADIIAFVFAMQYEGDPGDQARGQRFFEQRRCVHCHTLAALPTGGQASAGQASPVGMGEAIWGHGARMVEQMSLAGIPWPTFKGTDMADLISYLESAGEITIKPQFAGVAKPAGAGEGQPK